MKVINPAAELWFPKSDKQHVARCARVCYGKKIGNDDRTITHLKACKHLSMFRHESHYYIIPFNRTTINFRDISNIIERGYVIVGINIKHDNNSKRYFVVTNGQFELEHYEFCNYLKSFEVSDFYFMNTETGYSMMRYTFALTTQISTSRELNRVSPNNIAEQSTRYVYENGTLCKPHWISQEDIDKYNSTKDDIPLTNINNSINYLIACALSFNMYKRLVDNGLPKQDARGVLPLDTATKVVYTYSVDEWRSIILNRVHHITGKAHGNAVEVMSIVEDKLKELGYDFN